MPLRLRAIRPAARRLLVFAGASLTLHVATLVSFSPAGMLSAPALDPALSRVLDATLSPRRAINLSEANPDDARPERKDALPSREHPDDRMGVPGGSELPLPDKWYTATELDVRAEPLSEVHLIYPERLEGTGIPGRVQVLLFIDERGVVRRASVTDAEPARLFDEAALAAWVNMTFSPAKKGGVPVKSQKLLELNFQP